MNNSLLWHVWGNLFEGYDVDYIEERLVVYTHWVTWKV